MKRLILQEKTANVSNSGASLDMDVPEEIAEYISGLKLLYSIPFGYLVCQEEFLPAESMRFFCIDENWTSVLSDGALSIGRNDTGAARLDGLAFRPVLLHSQKGIRRVRYRKIHENHKQNKNAISFEQENGCLSGFLVRSALTKSWKGLEVKGFCGDKKLTILRADMIADDILICIFDGTLTKVEISEPKMGIRFGTYENNRVIQVKNVEEGAEFGHFLPGKEITLKADENGKLDVKDAAAAMKECLQRDITPSIFAFELMKAAQKAEFTEKGAVNK